MVNTKVVAVIAAQALLAFAVLLAPVKAQSVPEIPEEPNIVDVEGDGNALNDQGLHPAACNGTTCVGPGEHGDTSGGATIGAGDILEVWFTEDADTISINIHTVFPPPNSRFAIMYRILLNPGEGIDQGGCTWLEGYVPGTSWAGELSVRVREFCLEPNTDVETPGGVTVHALADETGITTMTFPKSAHPSFADGQTLAAPRATSRAVIGSGTTTTRRTAPQFDNTEPGTDYVVGSGAGGGSKPKPKPTATGTGTPAPTASPGTTPSPKPTSPPDKDKKKKKCPNKNKGSNSKKCKKKKGKGKGPTQPKPSPSPTSTPAPTSRPPTPSPTPTG